jgi:hypothetical protein
MSNFTSGNLKFRIKIPANVAFKIGMTDNYTNEKYITFSANESKYGLTRDGNWGQVTIPISDFAGLLAFQSMNYLFTIVSVDGQLPTSTFQLGLDDIYWEGGGGSTVVKVTGVTVSPSVLAINAGATQQLTATVAPSTATNNTVSWSSSNTAVATVSSSGMVTAVASGSAIITVITQDGGLTSSCAVTVNVIATGVATFYKDCNYGGYAIGLPVGDYNMNDLIVKGILNDDLSSIKITSGYEVQLFWDINFYGSTITYNSDISCLGSWNDQVTSLKVRASSVNTGCSQTASTGNFSTTVSNDASNPTLTFVPVTSGAGSTTCILYYSTDPSIVFPGYNVTPNTPFQITATAGSTVYFYYTYSLASGGENTTVNKKNSFTVGNCSTLKSDKIETGIVNTSDNAIQVYPIPMTDYLNVKLNKSIFNRLIIIDVTGKVLINEDISKYADLFNINVTSLTKGIYYLRLENSTTSVNKLILK